MELNRLAKLAGILTEGDVIEFPGGKKSSVTEPARLEKVPVKDVFHMPIPEIKPKNIRKHQIRDKTMLSIGLGKDGMGYSWVLWDEQMWRIKKLRPGQSFTFRDVDDLKSLWKVVYQGDDIVVYHYDLPNPPADEDHWSPVGKMDADQFKAFL